MDCSVKVGKTVCAVCTKWVAGWRVQVRQLVTGWTIKWHQSYVQKYFGHVHQLTLGVGVVRVVADALDGVNQRRNLFGHVFGVLDKSLSGRPIWIELVTGLRGRYALGGGRNGFACTCLEKGFRECNFKKRLLALWLSI